MCYVPQTENTFPSLTVRENLEMGAFTRDNDFSGRMEEIFEMFPDLVEKKNQRAGKLSGGQQQMVAMGRALMLDPKILLLDEPTAGLSPKLATEILQQVIKIKESGVSILMVEQNAKKALEMSDRGYVLAMGKNKFHDTGANLLANKEIKQLYLGG